MVRHFSAADLPEVIPVFPLKRALLLPRGRLPLKIFEPRYLAMLDDALRSDHRLIGMIQPCAVSGEEDNDGDENPPELQQIGCAGRVTSMSEADDGRYMIALSGICRFRVTSEHEGFTPYRRVTAGWDDFHDDLSGPEDDPAFDRQAFLDTLKQYFKKSGLSTDWDGLKSADTELLITSLSMMCPFRVEEKQALLEAPGLKERRETLEALMRFAIASSGNEKEQMQ